MLNCRAVALLVATMVPAPACASDIDPGSVNSAGFAELAPDGLIHPQIVKAQILLDRANMSPGEIDGKSSGKLHETLRAFAEARGLPANLGWGPDLWSKLAASSPEPVLTEYVVTREDARGPFVQLPPKIEDRKGLKTLGYGSLREALAEKFHMSEELLAVLNPGNSFAAAGEKVVVANVRTNGKPATAAHLDVDKDRQTVRAYSSGGELIGFFPASVGSNDKPTPSGTLKVTLIESDPSYHYNPKFRFREVDTQKPFDLGPGPNNPLGTMWIALSKPSYGIHGTPEPSLVGKSESHGCVRLTNWDAQRLAAMLSKGVAVNFIGKKPDQPGVVFAAY